MSDESNASNGEATNTATEENVEKVEDIVLDESEQKSEQVPEQEGEDTPESALQDELKAAKDQLLRVQAETQNIRRRAEQDVEKAHKFALEKFAGDVLSVADNLERALAAGDSEDDNQKPVLEGVELTLKSLLDVFAKYQIKQIDPSGEPFDPQVHEALTMVPNPAMEPNTVMDVMQKGYTLNERLIRPARVVVSKEA